MFLVFWLCFDGSNISLAGAFNVGFFVALLVLHDLREPFQADSKTYQGAVHFEGAFDAENGLDIVGYLRTKTKKTVGFLSFLGDRILTSSSMMQQLGS